MKTLFNFKRVSSQVISAWLLLWAALPLLLIFSLSFFSSNEQTIFSLPLTLKNFDILKAAYFYKILWRSLLLAILATAICFIIAYPFSYLLSKQKKKSLLIILILIPFWTSSLIRTYALVGLLKTKGLINLFLLKLGLIHSPLDMLYNQLAVIIGLSYNLLPFMILPLYNTFEKLDPNLIKVGQDLNASSFYIFRKIIWPLSIPGVKNSLLLVLLPAMTLFYIPNILGGAKSFLIGNLIENQFFVLDDWPKGAASSFILSLIMLLAMLINKPQKWQK